MALHGITWPDMALHGSARHYMTPNGTIRGDWSIDTRVVGRHDARRSTRRLVGRYSSRRLSRKSSVDSIVVGRHESRWLTRMLSFDTGVFGRQESCLSTTPMHEGRWSTRVSSVDTGVVGQHERRRTSDLSVDTRTVGRCERRRSTREPFVGMRIVGGYAFRRST